MTNQQRKAAEHAAEKLYPKVTSELDKNYMDRQRTIFVRGAQWAFDNMGWISVEDELPENMDKVMVCISLLFTRVLLMGTYSKVTGWIAYFADGKNKVAPHRPVTHWMPLPDPPKTEK